MHMHLLISGYSGTGGASAENAVLEHRDGGGNDLLGQGGSGCVGQRRSCVLAEVMAEL